MSDTYCQICQNYKMTKLLFPASDTHNGHAMDMLVRQQIVVATILVKGEIKEKGERLQQLFNHASVLPQVSILVAEPVHIRAEHSIDDAIREWKVMP